MTTKMTRLLGQTVVMVGIAIIVTNAESPPQPDLVVETPQQWIKFKKAANGHCAQDSSKISRKVSAGSATECSLLCLQELGCETFEFANGMCHFIEVKLNPKELMPKEGCRHYSMQNLTMKCPEPFIQRGRHCYYFSNIASRPSHFRSWSAAGLECQDRGGTRVAIETEEEQKTLMEIWKDLTALHIIGVNGFWTDGKKEAGSDKWMWASTNTPFTYKNWMPSAQNIKEQCCMLHILGNGHKATMGLGWRDYDCALHYYMGFVCEKKI